MQTIIIVLDSKKMGNPDLDLRYSLPERIAAYTNYQIIDNGYDYLSKTELGLWLETEDSAGNAEKVVQLLQTEKFPGNDLSAAAVYISEEECAELEQCRKIYPV